MSRAARTVLLAAREWRARVTAARVPAEAHDFAFGVDIDERAERVANSHGKCVLFTLGLRTSRPAWRRRLGARSASDFATDSTPATATWQPQYEKGCHMKGYRIASLASLSLEQAVGYLDEAAGDELEAAYELACDRNRLDGSKNAPDDTEVHHALFLLRRARGMAPPSPDSMRVLLRARLAA